ncbi:hypothetical protein ACWD0A_34510 [Streptomyces sp. NPDC002867]
MLVDGPGEEYEPAWSPDGSKVAFVVGNTRIAVAPTGEPRQITDDVSDAPSWSADSQQLLYLNYGRLRLVPANGGPPRTVAVPLTWTNVVPPARTVIHAGRMWDGVREEIRRDVDIVVEGHRITAVEPHAAGRAGRLVDARDRLVMPGLIDMHHHREMQGYAYGDRQGRLWLSLGVTTTRSPGSPAYHMVEERESTRSGARIAPRYFATGEAVDGPRIYYNFMRPTFTDAQLKLELERAKSLEYDLVKCYVRLPVVWHKQVAAFAHGIGIPVTAHYHCPAAAFGGDAMEHTGATNRFGYSRTVTPLGTAYDDVTDLFVSSDMARTPTLFGSTTLYREDRSLVEDHRARSLASGRAAQREASTVFPDVPAHTSAPLPSDAAASVVACRCTRKRSVQPRRNPDPNGASFTVPVLPGQEQVQANPATIFGLSPARNVALTQQTTPPS